MVFHDFTHTIISETERLLKLDGKEILQASPLMEYINIKTKSANRGSKARGSFANLYAIYVLVEVILELFMTATGNTKIMRVQFFRIYLQGRGNCLSVKSYKTTL